MRERWVRRATQLKRLVWALVFVNRDPRTPRLARIVTACVVAYAFSPIDLIPDIIPVLGYLDDLILIPLGVLLTIRLLPPSVWADAQTRAAEAVDANRPVHRLAAVVIVLLWVALTIGAVRLLWPWLRDDRARQIGFPTVTSTGTLTGTTHRSGTRPLCA